MICIIYNDKWYVYIYLGKTLCYALPILKRICSVEKSKRKPFQALIIVPTKELGISYRYINHNKVSLYIYSFKCI